VTFESRESGENHQRQGIELEWYMANQDLRNAKLAIKTDFRLIFRSNY
jgi:hypothetical protein